MEKTYGCEPALGSVAKLKSSYAGFVELHIEQGPVLDRAGIEIGIVESIAAPASLALTPDKYKASRPAMRASALPLSKEGLSF